MAKCPLAEILRDVDQLGDNPPLCSEQCGAIWNEAVEKGNYFTDVFESYDEQQNCLHPEVENYGQAIVRIGNTATRDLVFFENCTSCGDEVQATIYRFKCPHEIE